MKKYINQLLWNIPIASFFLQSRWYKKKYQNELAVLNNQPILIPDSPESLILFTVHKCASVYVSNILKKLATDCKMVSLNYEELSFNYCIGKENWSKLYLTGDNSVYPLKGCIIGPRRNYTEAIPNLETFNIILMLRDPRDVLTSFYFSMLKSHVFPKMNPEITEEIKARREDASMKSIDEYVLLWSNYFKKEYSLYCNNLLNKDNVCYVKYEDMILDFENWLTQIIDFCTFYPSKEVITNLVNESMADISNEDQSLHKRQVTPGDYKRKLKTSTIDKLNFIFSDELKSLNYPI